MDAALAWLDESIWVHYFFFNGISTKNPHQVPSASLGYITALPPGAVGFVFKKHRVYTSERFGQKHTETIEEEIMPRYYVGYVRTRTDIEAVPGLEDLAENMRPDWVEMILLHNSMWVPLDEEDEVLDPVRFFPVRRVPTGLE